MMNSINRKRYTVLLLLVVMCALISSCQIKSSIPQNKELEWEWCIEPKYEHLYFLADDLVEVRIDGEYSILNMNGEPISSQKFFGVSNFDNGIASVEANEGSFFINKSGETIFDEVFEATRGFGEGLAAVCKDDLWGFINESGEIVIDYQFDEVQRFNEQLAVVRKDNKWGVIDKSGKAVADFQFDAIRSFQNGYAAAANNGKWGFVNESGNIAIELEYDAVGNFSEGKAAVKLTEYEKLPHAWAYIDQSDNVVIDFFQYDTPGGVPFVVGDFEDGLAFVSKTFISIIDENGNNVFLGDSEFFISFAKYYKEFDAIPGYIYIDSAMKIKKYGLVGLDGKQRLEPVFDYIYGIHGDYVVVGKTVDGEGLMGVIRVS